MQMQKPYYIQVYDRLLTDIRIKSRLPLGTPDGDLYEWVHVSGPLLDKQLLLFIEGNGPFPVFPDWILPLALRFKSDDRARDLMWLRTLLVFCYKVEAPYDHKKLQKAVSAFMDCEDGITVWDSRFGSLNQMLIEGSSRLISRVIYRCDWKEIDPCHGPGAVFPPKRPSQKSNFNTLYSSIERLYPFWEYLRGNISEICYSESSIRGFRSCDDIDCKLIAVPKDSRGPRLICVHPAEAIWIQQGQRRVLERAISQSPLTRDCIKFNDQSLNGSLAREASFDQEFFTLDLKEASDRISCTLVRRLFGDYVYDIISCARASHVRLPDGSRRLLRKWAPMGNCLTFPVQSLIFWAICRYAIRSHCGVNCNEIYVFGDDIIAPTKYRNVVVNALVDCGLIPNEQKTFAKGFFRESCGIDAYKGFVVTPLRARQQDIINIEGIVSWLDLAKRLRFAGYDTCASWIYSTIRKRIGYLPLVNDPFSQGIVEYVPFGLAKLMRYQRVFWSSRFHTYVVRHRVVSSRIEARLVDDWHHLQDSLLSCDGSSPGTRYPIPYSAQLSYGWTPVLWTGE